MQVYLANGVFPLAGFAFSLHIPFVLGHNSAFCLGYIAYVFLSFYSVISSSSLARSFYLFAHLATACKSSAFCDIFKTYNLGNKSLSDFYRKILVFQGHLMFILKCQLHRINMYVVYSTFR